MFAMDRDAINTHLFEGRQPVAASNINPLDSVFTDAVPQYPHDPARAAALLDDAGWKRGPDGRRRNAAGEILRLTLSTTAGNLSRELVQQVIQSDWQKLGIDVAVRNQPPRVLFGDTLRLRRFDSTGVLYAWMSSPRNIPKTTLHSTMIPTPANNHAGQNYVGYAAPATDRLIDDLSVVCAPDANMALWHELQRRYAEELPALPLYYRAEAFFTPAWLAGVTPTGHMHPSTLWIENWRDTSAAEETP
jgi:peptide/nickel transport system substrate-binding protein